MAKAGKKRASSEPSDSSPSQVDVVEKAPRNTKRQAVVTPPIEARPLSVPDFPIFDMTTSARTVRPRKSQTKQITLSMSPRSAECPEDAAMREMEPIDLTEVVTPRKTRGRKPNNALVSPALPQPALPEPALPIVAASSISWEQVARQFGFDEAPCELNSKKRKNCDSPNCLHQLGYNSKSGIWAERPALCRRLGRDPEAYVRQAGQKVGLTNLGATCYLNSLIQALFMLPKFRSLVFQADCSHLTGKDNIEIEIMNELQNVFSHLQLSTRTAFEPRTLVDIIGLRHTEQQDAQEFGKLFLDQVAKAMRTIEASSSSLNRGGLSSEMRTLFGGVQEYVTQCQKCKFQSKRSEEFSELQMQIKGLSKLDQSLAAYFQQESLSGSNQYFCSSCQCKQDAIRSTSLTSLPEVLNVQLLRFVFDPTTGRKRKLQDCIEIPEVINLTPFVTASSSSTTTATPDCIYDLVAILRHQGTSAYHGHYVAEARDDGLWWRFDDECVKQLESCPASREEESKEIKDDGKSEAAVDQVDSPPAKVESDKEVTVVEPPKSKKRGRPSANTVESNSGSRNAYMLMYIRRSSTSQVPALQPPHRLLDRLNATDEEFRQQRAKYQADLCVINQFIERRKATATQLVQMNHFGMEEIDISACEDPAYRPEPFYLVSTAFLRDWLIGEPSESSKSVSASTTKSGSAEDADLQQALDASMADAAIVLDDEVTESKAATDQKPIAAVPAILPAPYPLTSQHDWNDHLLCQHQKADPLKAHLMKRIHPKFWEAIAAEYTFNTVLDQSSVCDQCTSALDQNGVEIQTRLQRLSTLVSQFDDFCKVSKVDQLNLCIVSKLFVKEWKSAIKKAVDRQCAVDFSSVQSDINADLICTCAPVPFGASSELPPPRFSTSLTSKILPEQVKKMVTISGELWSNILCCDARFHNSSVIQVQNSSTETVENRVVCQLCLQRNQEQTSDAIKSGFERERERKKVNITPSSMDISFPLAEIVPGKYCIVPQSWFDVWSSYIRYGTDRPVTLDLSSLLCSHRKLAYAPWPQNSQVDYQSSGSSSNPVMIDELPAKIIVDQVFVKSGELRLIPQADFSKFRELYPVANADEIESVTVEYVRHGSRGTGLTAVAWCGVQASSQPEVCLECALARVRQELERDLNFTNGSVVLTPGAVAESVMPTMRRSSRARKTSTVIELVSSSTTIFDIKMMLMVQLGDMVTNASAFVFAHNDVVLDNVKTLKDCMIANGATITYALSAVPSDPGFDAYDVFDQGPERGFSDSKFFS